MQNLDYSDLVILARLHYENLKADIENASTRIEHIRITALAQEAQNLYHQITELVGGNGPDQEGTN